MEHPETLMKLELNLKPTKAKINNQNENQNKNNDKNNISRDTSEKAPLFSAETKQECVNNTLVTFNKDVQLVIYDINNDNPRDRSQTTFEIVKLKPAAENRNKKNKNKISPENKAKIIKRINQIENQIGQFNDHSLTRMNINSETKLAETACFSPPEIGTACLSPPKSDFRENYSKCYRLTKLETGSWKAGKIPYVAVELGDYKRTSDTLHEVEAMCDSGASHTYLSNDLFNLIPDKNRYIQNTEHITITLGKGLLRAKDAVIATIPLQLYDTDGKLHTRFKRVTVLKELENSMFLGSDFIYDTKVVKFNDPNGLHFNTPDYPTIPFIWKHTTQTINLFATEDILLNPKEVRIITARCEKEPKYKGTYLIHDNEFDGEAAIISAEHEARLNALGIPLISVCPSLAVKQEKNLYDVIIENTSENEFMSIEMNTPVALLTHDFSRQGFHTLNKIEGKFGIVDLDPNVDYYEINAMTWDDEDSGFDLRDTYDPDNEVEHPLEPNAENLDHKVARTLEEIKAEAESKRRQKAIEQATAKINASEYWNQEEKQQQIEHFIRYGYIEYPASETIDKSVHMTEFHDNDEKVKTDDEIIKEIKVEHLDPTTRDKVLDLCKKYLAIFTRSEMDIGENRLGIVADCILKQSHDFEKPVNAKLRPFPFQIRETVQAILDKMERAGLVSSSNSYSPIVSQLLIQKKKGTMKPRVILDLRQVNAACLKLPAQLPSQQEVFSIFAGKTLVSTCDIANFFFTIPVRKDKRPLFCFFDTKNTRKQLNVLPQGFRNSSAYAAELTGRLLEGLDSFHTAFVDDIFIATPDLETPEKTVDFHIHQLELLFQRLIIANLKIKPAKFEPMKNNIEILGYLYDSGTFSIPEHRVNAIQKIPRPKTPKAIKSYLALVSYFRIFIRDYAKFCVPILDVLKKSNKKVLWTPEAQKAFLQIKEEVKQAIRVSAPRFDRDFLMSCDASLVAHGSVLWQLDDNEVAYYLGCTSKVFTQTERNTSSFYREIMCLVSALLHFSFYLEYADAIKIFTDALSILWLKAIRQGLGKLFRYALIMSTFELTICHIPRKKDRWIAELSSVGTTKVRQNRRQCARESAGARKIPINSAVEMLKATVFIQS